MRWLYIFKILLFHLAFGFKPREYVTKKVGSSFLNIEWDRFSDNETYQVWYWPLDNASKAKSLSVNLNSVFLRHLISGQTYNIWIIAMTNSNMSSGYLTFQQSTGSL